MDWLIDKIETVLLVPVSSHNPSGRISDGALSRGSAARRGDGLSKHNVQQRLARPLARVAIDCLFSSDARVTSTEPELRWLTYSYLAQTEIRHAE